MQGKTVIVTGATSGIGMITARELARKGARTVIISRNQQKCVTVAEQIKGQTGNQQVEYIVADLSTKAGVSQAAYEFKKGHSRLDVLVNNAGAIFMERKISPEGIEMTLALNHLNYFHLTMLLLDVLKSSAPARIINVSSDAHRGQKIDFDDLQSEKSYSGFTAYGRSKMMNVLFTYELARRLNGSNVTVNAMHPGFVATDFAKNNGGVMEMGMKVVNLFARKPEKGAETAIYLASSREVDGVTSSYFHDMRQVESDTSTYKKADAERLWNASLELML